MNADGIAALVKLADGTMPLTDIEADLVTAVRALAAEVERLHETRRIEVEALTADAHGAMDERDALRHQLALAHAGVRSWSTECDALRAEMERLRREADEGCGKCNMRLARVREVEADHTRLRIEITRMGEEIDFWRRDHQKLIDVTEERDKLRALHEDPRAVEAATKRLGEYRCDVRFLLREAVEAALMEKP